MAVLLFLGVLVYLNQVGLPGFVKRPLLDKLRSRGLDLEFSRLRLSWYKGIVAERVRFGRADEPLSPQFTFAEVQVPLNLRALMRRQIQIDALVLRQGRLVWPIPETGTPPRQLAIEDIQTDLRLLPNDEWALDNFRAGFAGAKLQLSGTITHASAVRGWKIFQPKQSGQAGAPWRNRLRRLADTLEQVHFASTPELGLDVRGDARDPQSFNVRLFINAPGAETPWGSLAQGRLAARLFPAASNQLAHAELSLRAAHALTRWGSITDLHLFMNLASGEEFTNLVNGNVQFEAARAQTPWAAADKLQLAAQFAPLIGETNLVGGNLAMQAERATSLWATNANTRFTAQWLHALSNVPPSALGAPASLPAPAPGAPASLPALLPAQWLHTLLSGQAQLDCTQVETQWGGAQQARFLVRLSPATPGGTQPDAPAHDPGGSSPPVASAGAGALSGRAESERGWWTNLEPYALHWECGLSGYERSDLPARQLTGGGNWRSPMLNVTNLHVNFAQGQLDASAALNVATRALEATVESDTDPRQLAPVLPESARRWIGQFAWEQPPRVSGRVALVLPAWTNRAPDWQGEVLPTLRLAGQFDAPRGGAYKGVPVSSAQSHFSYSNLCWRLPDLHVRRPEGEVLALHQANDRTKEFYWRVAGTADPRAVRPLLSPDEQRGLDLLTFSRPPFIEAEVWGRGHDRDALGFSGRVSLTNFTFRGEAASSLQTALQYTNQVLRLLSPRLTRGAQQMTADGLTADFPAKKVYLTNGFSTAEPMVVARAIGPNVARALEPYRFIDPPAVHAYGVIPMQAEEGADLSLQVVGGPFHWLNFNLLRLAGDLHWSGLRLALDNMRTEFYGGLATGSASFDFSPSHPGTDFQFSLTATNTLLQSLMADLSTRTNHLEGRLDGTLTITGANTENWRRTQGHGTVRLRDGLIWDIPLFGVLSQPLDSLMPGLGSSRASAGACNFMIVNGIIHSEDLEIRSPAMRLLYRGDTDLQGRLKAQVEALLLRDVPLVGPVVSTVLWPVTKVFEYKVTGSLNEPKTEPLYLIPRIVLMPFHPLRTFKGLLLDDSRSRTNSPPALRP